MRMDKRNNNNLVATESEEQIALFQWAEWQSNIYPELKRLFHIPNGGLRNKATAKRLKAEGVKSGVPDLCLPVPRGQYHGLYIEIKRIKGNNATPSQNEWISFLLEQGYYATVCKGAQAAIEVILNYLKISEKRNRKDE